MTAACRVSHYYVQWGEIETEPGVYDWTVPDYILEATALEGLQFQSLSTSSTPP